MNSRLVVFKVLGISRKQLGFGSWKACLGCDYTLNHFALCPLRWFYSLNNYHSTNKHFNIHNWTIWVWTCLDLNLTLEASVVWRFLHSIVIWSILWKIISLPRLNFWSNPPSDRRLQAWKHLRRGANHFNNGSMSKSCYLLNPIENIGESAPIHTCLRSLACSGQIPQKPWWNLILIKHFFLSYWVW